MGKITSIVFLFLAIVIYFLIFNFAHSSYFPQVFSFLDSNQTTTSTSGGGVEKVGVGADTAITGFSPGDWTNVFLWDERTEYYPEYEESVLYIFGFIPLPTVLKGVNFFWLHTIFFVVSSIIFLSIIFRSERGYYE